MGMWPKLANCRQWVSTHQLLLELLRSPPFPLDRLWAWGFQKPSHSDQRKAYLRMTPRGKQSWQERIKRVLVALLNPVIPRASSISVLLLLEWIDTPISFDEFELYFNWKSWMMQIPDTNVQESLQRCQVPSRKIEWISLGIIPSSNYYTIHLKLI